MRSRIMSVAVVAFVVGGVAAWGLPDPAGERKVPERFLGLLSVGDVVVWGHPFGDAMTVVTPEELVGMRLTPEEAEEAERLRGIETQMPRTNSDESKADHQRRVREWNEKLSRMSELDRKASVRDYQVVRIGEDYVVLRGQGGQTQVVPVHRIETIRNGRVRFE